MKSQNMFRITGLIWRFLDKVSRNRITILKVTFKGSIRIENFLIYVRPKYNVYEDMRFLTI